METKVDLAALVGGGPRNSTTGRAPLADGAEEVAGPTPVTPEPPELPSDSELAVGKNTTTEDMIRFNADRDNEAFDAAKKETPDREDGLLVAVDEAGMPSAVFVAGDTIGSELVKATEEAASITMDDMSEVQVLRAALADLTKRLEDFGAIPKKADAGPYVPVVTITKAGNKRTDW